MAISLSSTLQKFDSNLWGYHLLIPHRIAHEFITGNDRRVICTLNNLIKTNSALMPIADQFFILVNKESRVKLNLKIGDAVNVSLEKDTSDYGMPMPESFQVLLKQDEMGNELFHGLAPGNRRSLLYIIGKVKNVDSQINKGLAILDHMKETGGKLNFKLLTAKIKEYNQRGKIK